MRASTAATAFACLAACGPSRRPKTPYDRALDAAHALARHDRHAEAVEAFRRARAACRLGNDCAEAELGEARALRHAGHPARALALYERIAEERRDEGHVEARVRALLEAAAVCEQTPECPRARAIEALREIVVGAPGSGLAPRALGALERIWRIWRDGAAEPPTSPGSPRSPESSDARGARAVLAGLDDLLGRTVRTAIGDNVLFAIARVQAELGDSAETERTLARLLADYPYPNGGFWDDAHWMLADLHEARGDVRAALADLRRMLAVRESSSFSGSYELPRFDDAALRIARLYEQRLHDPSSAADAYHAVWTEFVDSILRDDALAAEARVRAQMGQTGRACRLWGRLAREFPASRHAEHVPDRRAALGCRD